MKIYDYAHPKGYVKGIIDYVDGSQKEFYFNNSILDKGREALAASLGNQYGDTYDFYIAAMLFGDGGESGGSPKFVNAERNGLFGVTRVNKPVIASIDEEVPSQVIFTSVISFSEGNGFVLDEMALQMNNGDFYSMATFGGITKTSAMQITWNWRLTFI